MNRQAILVAGLGALIPVTAASLPATAIAEPGGARFNPPERAELTRTVWRYLSDGQQIVVTRRYAVEFAPSAEGYRLTGSLINSLPRSASIMTASDTKGLVME